MKDFYNYIEEWWDGFIADTTPENCLELMESWIDEDATPSDYIDVNDPQAAYNWLTDNVTDGSEIYAKHFSYDSDIEHHYDFLPTTTDLLTDIFMKAAGWPGYPGGTTPSFAVDFVSDMAEHASGYNDPTGFFKDLAYGGCQSGLIGFLIYNSDCKKIYIDHIDDMEDFKMRLEDEMGGPIPNRQQLPHYTFVCWLCYEELGYTIARNLFLKTF